MVGDLPPHEAFPIGGTNSVRGYDEGAVGSGRSYVVASAEVSVPLVSGCGARVCGGEDDATSSEWLFWEKKKRVSGKSECEHSGVGAFGSQIFGFLISGFGFRLAPWRAPCSATMGPIWGLAQPC